MITGTTWSYEDFSRSATASENGISNTIPDQYKLNIANLCSEVLCPICKEKGWVLSISSGYRSQELNSAVGGVQNSLHLLGCAADCVFSKFSNGKYVPIPCAEVINTIKEMGVPYTEVLSYSKRGFVHIGYDGTLSKKVLDDDYQDGYDEKLEYLQSQEITSYSIISVPYCDSRKANDKPTIDEFVDQMVKVGNLSKKEEFSISKWLGFTDGNKTNKERIVEKYTPAEKKEFEDDIKNDSLPFIYVGTRVLFDVNILEATLNKLEGSDIFLEQSSAKNECFWAENISKLMKSDDYVPISGSGSQKDGDKVVWRGNFDFVKQRVINCRVWVYSYAVGKLFDVSTMVQSLSTNKTKDSGSFNISLSPINESSIYNFITGNYHLEYIRQFCNNFTNLQEAIPLDWFSKVFQKNDPVFIRYEALKIEEKSKSFFRSNSSYDVIVPLSDLDKDCVWDMIGFIDTIVSTQLFESNDYSISVSGRDYTKFLEDDGCYLLPWQFMMNGDSFMTKDDGAFFNRNLAGSYDNLSYIQTIKSLLAFIFDKLVGVGVVSNELFEASAVRSGETSKDTGVDLGKNNAEGIWRIFQIDVQKLLNDRGVVDSSFVSPNGTIKDLLGKVCQDPFVETIFDTWGSAYHMVVRQPPFNKEAVMGFLNSSERKASSVINVDDIYSMNLSFDNRAYSWYRIIPQNDVINRSSEALSLALFPIFYIDEYVKIYGNRRLIVSDNYFYAPAFLGREAEGDIKDAFSKVLEDYLFLIETNVYLPFTRKGTITINGDRRIKVGTFVILSVTQELFYVTEVRQNCSFSNDSVDRTTTITVERGMVIDNIKDDQFSYFNIVNLPELRKNISENFTQKGGRQILSRQLLNLSVFEFFRKRLQFRGGVSSGDLTMTQWGDLDIMEQNGKLYIK